MIGFAPTVLVTMVVAPNYLGRAYRMTSVETEAITGPTLMRASVRDRARANRNIDGIVLLRITMVKSTMF